MKIKIIYTLLFAFCFFGGVNAQLACFSEYEVVLDENGEAEILASDLIPNVEFFIATGTVTYFILPFNSGEITSGSDVINLNCNSSWGGSYIIEYTENGDLLQSCWGTIDVQDPTNSCPNGSNYCEEAGIECKNSVDGYSLYSSTFNIAAENFAICSSSAECTGSYAVAIGHITNAENLDYNPSLDSDDIEDYATQLVISYTENGVTEYDQSTIYVWENKECYLIPNASVTLELDLTAEFTIVPEMFLGAANTCTEIMLAVTEVNGAVPTDFVESVSLDCDDLGYHDVYFKDAETGAISSSQLFLADPLETCGPALGPGDKLILMANDPPLGTYANTEIAVNGTDLATSPSGKGWIINEDMLADGGNTMNFDSGPLTLNGISTLDLVLLMRLIIFDNYDNPMQAVVMDIDKSGYNGIGDLVTLRSLILGLPVGFDIDNTLFKPVEFEFPSDFTPFDFDYDFTKYDFEKSDFENLSFEFDAFQVGDINGSAVLEDGLKYEEIATTRDFDVFEVTDINVAAGVPFSFALSYDAGVPIKGLLAALVSNGVKFESLTTDLESEVEYNIINDTEIRISYIALNPNVTVDKIAFVISATSENSGSLIDLLGLKSGFPQEVINENNEVIIIEDLEAQTTTSVSNPEFALEVSVYPNPVSQKLNLTSEDSQLGTIEIIDPMGKTVLKQTSEQNTVQLDISRFTNGLYYLSIENEKGRINKTFIKI